MCVCVYVLWFSFNVLFIIPCILRLFVYFAFIKSPLSCICRPLSLSLSGFKNRVCVVHTYIYILTSSKTSIVFIFLFSFFFSFFLNISYYYYFIYSGDTEEDILGYLVHFIFLFFPPPLLHFIRHLCILLYFLVVDRSCLILFILCRKFTTTQLFLVANCLFFIVVVSCEK